MSQEIEELVLRVRADTGAFARDVTSMRSELEGPLAAGVERAGRTIEHALGRAIRTGKFGFDDLKRVALTAMGEIAAAGLKAVLSPGGQQAGGGGGIGSILSSLVASVAGAPGRAHGGPVSAGRPYWVGERGPELFVPGAGGRIVNESGGKDVRVAISIATPTPSDPRVLQRSSRQVARAVAQAMGERR